MTRRVSFLGFVVLIAASALWWWHTQASSALWRPALNSRQIATRVLAEYMAKQCPGTKVLVFGNPFTQRSGQSAEIYAFEQTEIRGLQEGFPAPDAIKVVYPELRPEFLRQPDAVYVDPKTTTPLSFLVAVDAFDRLARANPDRPVLISLIGLPANLRECQVWRDGGPLRFALLLPDWRMVGGREAIRNAVKSEKIAAAVVNRPETPASDVAAEKDYQAEFARHYLLVTKENIDQVLETYPQLF